MANQTACTGLQNKSKRRLDCDTAAGEVQQGADLIVTKAFILLLVKVEEGTLRIFPMLLTVARLSLPLLLLSLRSMALE